MAHMVLCPVCNIRFDADIEEYVLEGRRYIHKKCYEERKRNQLFIDDIHLYMRHMLGELYSKNKIDKQIKDFIAEGKTAEGINKTIKYWYEVKKSDPSKAQGGIGIVGYIYGEAMEYYKTREENLQKNKDIEWKQETEVLQIFPKPVEKPKRIKLFNLP